MTFKSTLSVLALFAASPALADCPTVRFSDVGWTDITATTAATTTAYIFVQGKRGKAKSLSRAYFGHGVFIYIYCWTPPRFTAYVTPKDCKL